MSFVNVKYRSVECVVVLLALVARHKDMVDKRGTVLENPISSGMRGWRCFIGRVCRGLYVKLLYQDGGRHGSFKDEKTFRSVLPFPVVYLSLVSLHFRLTSIEIGLSEISFLFSVSLSFFLSRQKNLIGQCRGMISAIECSSTFLLSRMYKKKRNFAFKLDVDTLNESGGNSVFRGNWGGGGSIRVKLKKFPKWNPGFV